MKRITACILALIIMISASSAVGGAEISKLYSDEPLNSWRYTNGVPNNAIAPLGMFSSGEGEGEGEGEDTPLPWSKTDDGYVNDKGEIIQNATMKGIDVSEWNYDIDWERVTATDVDYAMIRCGYGDNIESQDDKYFKQNVKGCIDNKIPFGIYIYSYAENTSMALSEAKHVLRLINGYRVSFPIYLDMEDNVQKKLSKSQLGTIAKTFCTELQKRGFQVGIYANLYWWNNYLTDPVFSSKSWNKWVAQYNSSCDYNGKYTMWQSTSTGKVDGINSNVDINFWYAAARKSTYYARSSAVYLNRTAYSFTRSANYPAMTLKAVAYSSNGNKSVIWKTSNKNVALVNSYGKVTARGRGTCYITATLNDGSKKYARCKVTVKQLVTKVKLNKSTYTLKKKGKSYQLKAVCYPTKANVKTILWKTSNKKIATVNSKGKVTAKKKGSCYITASARDGSKKYARCKIIVKK